VQQVGDKWAYRWKFASAKRAADQKAVSAGWANDNGQQLGKSAT
jgi:hypothetical protein